MAIVAVDGYCSLLGKVPRVQDMHLAKVQGHRRATEIADRNRVARFVSAVLDCAELFDLTLHAGRISWGVLWSVLANRGDEALDDPRHFAPRGSTMSFEIPTC